MDAMATDDGSKKSSKTNDLLTTAFDLLDLEGNGDLEFLEFKLGLKSLHLNVSHEEAIQLFESIDSDKAGYIDRDMFTEWLNKDINSPIIQNLRNKIKSAIGDKQTNIIDEDDAELEQEMKAIERRLSQKHPELGYSGSQDTVVENDSDGESTDLQSDSSNNSKNKHNRNKSKSKSHSRSKSKKHNKHTSKHSKHNKHASSKGSNPSMERIFEGDKESDSETDDDSSVVIHHRNNSNNNNNDNNNNNNNNDNINSNDNLNAHIRGDRANSESISKTMDTTKAVQDNFSPQLDPADMDPAMLAQYEFLREQELRRLTRDVEARHNINETNADKFTGADINDIAGEMLMQMNRLARKGSQEAKNINKHIREFSDSLDSSRLQQIQMIHSDTNNIINEFNNINNDNTNDISNGYTFINHDSNNGTNNPNKNEEEIDSALIDTIEMSLSHGNSNHIKSLQQGNYSNHSINSGKMEASSTNSTTTTNNNNNNNNNSINNGELSENASAMNKKTSLTLDNEELEIQQTGNIAIDDNASQTKQKTTKINENNNENEEIDVEKELKTLSERSETVKGRAGSMVQQFQARTSGNNVGMSNINGNNTNNNNNNNNNTALYDAESPTATNNINNINDINNNNSNLNTKQNRALSDTLHSIGDMNMTTRATSHSYDRLFTEATPMMNAMNPMITSPHAPTSNLKINNNSNNNISPKNKNNNSGKFHTGLTPMITAAGGSFSGLNNTLTSIPALPTGHGMLHSTSHQPIMITNTPQPYQPPIPTGNTMHSLHGMNNPMMGSMNSMNNSMNGMNTVHMMNAMTAMNTTHAVHGGASGGGQRGSIGSDMHSHRSDSHHSISLSHHSSFGGGGGGSLQGSLHGSLQGSGVGGYTVDISDITGNSGNVMGAAGVVGSGGGGGLGIVSNDVKESLIGGNASREAKSCVTRFINWYLEPIHTKSTFKRLLYHGANFVFSTICCVVTVSLLIFSIPTVITCCLGVLGFFGLFESCRIFAAFDMQLGLYFFDTKDIPRFSIYIPMIHSGNITSKLRYYFTDPHMLQILFYLMIIKFPSSLMLSGVSLVLFAGVTSVLLTPLIFWFEPDYFNEGNFCVFGSYTGNENNPCSGWSIDSFGDTIGAFLLFLPLMPLTLRLCKYTAKLLFRITCNFMTMDVKYREKRQKDKKSGYTAIEPLERL